MIRIVSCSIFALGMMTSVSFAQSASDIYSACGASATSAACTTALDAADDLSAADLATLINSLASLSAGDGACNAADGNVGTAIAQLGAGFSDAGQSSGATAVADAVAACEPPPVLPIIGSSPAG